jgi:hypothetical protein
MWKAQLAHASPRKYLAQSGRMRALISLVRHRGATTDIIDKLNTLSRKIEGLGRQRNEYVHHPVSITETGKLKRVHVSADRHLDFNFKSADLDDMKKLFRNIRAASVEFDALYDRILSELPPWPRKQFAQSDRGIRRRKRRNKAIYASFDHLRRNFNIVFGRASTGRIIDRCARTYIIWRLWCQRYILQTKGLPSTRG